MATIPPVSLVKSARPKPASATIARKRLGVRKARDRFDEIAIGVAVSRHEPAEHGNDVKRIGFIEPVEQRHIDIGEFEAEEPTAPLQDAVRLGERLVDPRHVANAEGDRIGVEDDCPAKGKSSALASTKSSFASQRSFFAALAADLQHVRH